MQSQLSAQVIKVSGGFSNTAIQAIQNGRGISGILDEENLAFSALFGIDYLERRNFYLTSEIGYYRDGGKSNVIIDNEIVETFEYWDYLHLTSSFRFKLPFRNGAHLYAGAGPKLDVLFGSRQFKNQLYNEYTDFKKDRFSLGGKAEAGLVQDINRIRVGLNVSCLAHIGDAGGDDFIGLQRENSVSVVLSLGYKLN